MNSFELIIKNSILNQPIGETENIIWYICDIGIIALFKHNKSITEQKILIEALNIALDLSKEEKESFLIDNKKLILFYS